MVVYRHIRLDKNEVFYIGIGREKRPYSKKDRNKYWHNIVNKSEYKIDILFDDLTWHEACEKEKEFIKLYGRKDLGTGTLVNMSEGGGGVWPSGENNPRFLDRPTKEKNPMWKKKHINPEKCGHQKNIGKKHSNETKEKMSKSMSKPKLTEQEKKDLINFIKSNPTLSQKSIGLIFGLDRSTIRKYQSGQK